MVIVDLALMIELGIQVEVGLAQGFVTQANPGAHALGIVGAALAAEQDPAIHRQGAAITAGFFTQGVVPHRQLHVLRSSPSLFSAIAKGVVG
ncbi:hypothetical protein D3C72_1222130 [compost metagenome]